MAALAEQDVLIKLQVEAGQAIKQMETASQSVSRLTTAANDSQRPMRQLQQNVRNASYQFTDFVVQVQGGQSAMLAFSQQAPQLLAGFGAVGAAVGLVAALAPAVVTAFNALTKEGKTLEESIKQVETAMQGLKETFNFTDRKSLDPLIEQYKTANQETRQLILSNLELNVAIAKVAANDLNISLVNSIKEGINELGFFKSKWIELQDTIKNSYAFTGKNQSFVRAPEENLKTGFGIDQSQLDTLKTAQRDFEAAKISATDFFATVSKVYLATSKPTEDFTKWVQGIQKATKAQKELELATTEYQSALERLRQGNTTTVKGELQSQKEWEKARDKEIDQIQKEFDALEKLGQARTKEADALRAASNPMLAYSQALEKARILLNDNKISQNEFADAVYRAQSILANSNTMVNSFGDALANAFNGAIIGGKSFGQVMTGLATDIQAAIVKIMIIEPLIRSLKIAMVGTGFFSPTTNNATPFPTSPQTMPAGGTVMAANGNVFSGGNVIPFATGGIVSRPTVFPMANGTGLMGEAGPEAIMPLKRGPDGKLGVSGGGGGGTVVNVFNQTENKSEVKESTNADGQKQIDVYIYQTVQKMIGNGSMDKTMQSVYGINRVGRR